jgi:hypothetical protein
MSRQFLLVTIVRLSVVALLCLSSGAAIGQAQAADAEKIRDISPDGQFAMRISYDEDLNTQSIESEKADPDKIFPGAIKGVDLVAVPSKKIVTNLLGEENPFGKPPGLSIVLDKCRAELDQ